MLYGERLQYATRDLSFRLPIPWHEGAMNSASEGPRLWLGITNSFSANRLVNLYDAVKAAGVNPHDTSRVETLWLDIIKHDRSERGILRHQIAILAAALKAKRAELSELEFNEPRLP